MIRRDFCLRLFAAPLAVLAGWRLKPTSAKMTPEDIVAAFDLQPWQRQLLGPERSAFFDQYMTTPSREREQHGLPPFEGL